MKTLMKVAHEEAEKIEPSKAETPNFDEIMEKFSELFMMGHIQITFDPITENLLLTTMTSPNMDMEKYLLEMK
jgi:hypothetical protein